MPLDLVCFRRKFEFIAKRVLGGSIYFFLNVYLKTAAFFNLFSTLKILPPKEGKNLFQKNILKIMTICKENIYTKNYSIIIFS